MIRPPHRPKPITRAVPWLALLLAGCGAQDLYAPPGAPFELTARVPLPSANEGVALLGDHAFVAGGQAGLHVIDIADPAAPRLLRTLDTTKFAVSIETIRTFARRRLVDIALVVEGTEGVTTYDITDPANLYSFNQGTTAVDGVSLFVVQPADPDRAATVYLAENWKGLRIFQTNPDYPGVLEYNGVFSSTQGYAKGIAVRDGWAYVADDEMGLCVLDVRELVLGSVRVVAWCDSPGNAMEVALEGDHAFVADGSRGLAVFGIDGGETPRLVASLNLSGFNRAIAVRDGLAVLAAAAGGVHFVDVSRPEQPRFLGTIITSYATDLVLAERGFVLVSDRVDGLLVLTGRGPFRDVTPPAAVTDLAASPVGGTLVELSWHAPGDNGFLGRAARYEIRYAAAPITDEAAWEAAATIPDPPTPGPACRLQTFVAGGLQPETSYHFALRAFDEAELRGGLSNSAAATTLAGSALLAPALTPPAGTPDDLFVFEITYVHSDGSAPVQRDVVVDGTLRLAMEYVGGDHATGALYRAQASLGKGAHTHLFSFADAAGHVVETEELAGPLVGAVVFAMGSPPAEPGREPDETQHVVVLTNRVLASPHEVTQAEWSALGLDNPSRFLAPDLPVERVTWLQAASYCNLRSAVDGLAPAYIIEGDHVTWLREADGWRLPTEAEWEWLCRAGTTTALAGGPLAATACEPDPVLGDWGWYCGNAGPGTHPVGGKNANAFGLHDMHGNVWEWCWDWYAPYVPGPVLDPEGPASGFRRVIRGGSWYYYARDCRSASRGFYFPDSADDIVGFRVVRTVRDR